MDAALDPSIRRYRLTVDDVERMVESGIVGEDAAVELLEGELVAVSPQGPAHASAKAVLAERLRRAFAGDGYVRDQDPLQCGRFSLPEPDLAVVGGGPEDHRARHPRGDEARLVVEVSRTTQRVDRAKALVYARAGVPEYWLVDVEARVVLVHREPHDDGYAVHSSVDEAGVLELPGDVLVAVRELFG